MIWDPGVALKVRNPLPAVGGTDPEPVPEVKRLAPEAFRSTRVKTTEHVKSALLATDDLKALTPDRLRANPGALPTLRMCTAPPLAVDRLIGLSSANK